MVSWLGNMCQSVIGRVLNQQEIEKKVVFEEHDRKITFKYTNKKKCDTMFICTYMYRFPTPNAG